MIDHTYDFPRFALAHKSPWLPKSRVSLLALGLLAAVSTLVAPSVARAQAPAPVRIEGSRDVAEASPVGFAQAGQFFVSLGSGSLLQTIWAKGFEKTYSIEVAPAVGYFFTEHLFARLGFEMQLDQMPKAAQDVGDLRTFALAVAPGIGGAWHVHPKITIAPWAGVGAGRVWRSLPYSGYRTTVDMQASVPVVFDFVEHVSFFVAPGYKQLVLNQETFPESERQASLGGRFGVSMGALAHW